ncbi:MAG: endo-1,4-beta-xylanase, partial [Bacillota bacterium]|nr:endo-1,4-beta-xylanase [Bacillota bacterium]
QTPSWLFKTNYNGSNGYVSQSVMNARMEFYIKSVMGHVFSSKYGSVIYAWDVANEYLHASNSGSGWQMIYGSNLGTQAGFLKSAFQYAYQELKTYGLTDKVKLFYNDYNEYMEVNDIINLINYINSDGKVCAGIGMQSHLSTDFPSVASYKSALQSFVKAGFEIQMTELDVGCTDFNVQAKYYYDLMSAILSVKKAGGNISAIVWWGLSDDCSWRSKDKPLLFSTIGVPKSAYTSVLQAYFDAGYDLNTPTTTPTPSPTPTPTPTPQLPISAFTQIEAENYSDQSGIKAEDCSEGGQDIGFIENGDYAVYKNVDFGSGSSNFQARVASAASGSNIEIRLDSIDGKLVGTCPVSGTGDWQTWTNATCSVSGVSGIHDLYLKFTGGSSYLLNVNWFKFGVTPKTHVGDVNGDGKVNTLDYLLMKRYISGAIKDFPAVDDDLWAGDINGDGVINNTDYVLLRTHILKNEQGFAKEQVAVN